MSGSGRAGAVKSVTAGPRLRERQRAPRPPIRASRRPQTGGGRGKREPEGCRRLWRGASPLAVLGEDRVAIAACRPLSPPSRGAPTARGCRCSLAPSGPRCCRHFARRWRESLLVRGERLCRLCALGPGRRVREGASKQGARRGL